MIPPLYDGCQSAYIPEAYWKIFKDYERGERLLSSEEPDIMRLSITADDLERRCMPLVGDLRRMEEVPRDWLQDLSACIVDLEDRLRTVAHNLENLDHQNHK